MTSIVYGACNPNPEAPPINLEKADILAAKTSPALLKSLNDEIQAIIKDGVNIRSLMELSKFCHVAQELLMVRTPLAEVRRKKRGRLPQYQNSMSVFDPPVGYQFMYDDELGPLTQEAAQNETFGAQVTKQIVSAIGALKRNDGPSVEELIDGIKQAKDAGLDRVVERLEAKLEEALGGEPSGEAPAPDDSIEVESSPVEHEHDEGCGCDESAASDAGFNLVPAAESQISFNGATSL